MNDNLDNKPIIEECIKQGAILYEKKKFVVTDEDFLSRYSV